MVAWGLNKAQFICYISHFVTWFLTIHHISSVKLAMGVLYPSYFPHLSACFKLLLVMMVFFLRLEFLPFFAFKLKIKSINQRQWEKDRGTEGHLNPFQSSQSFRQWNKQEIKMELEMLAIPLFRGLDPGAFLNNSTCFKFCSAGILPSLINFLENGKKSVLQMTTCNKSLSFPK